MTGWPTGGMASFERHVILMLAVMALCTRMGNGQVCPYGWVDRAGSDTCYLLSADTTKYKFEDITGKCQSYGGQPLAIASASEKDWLVEQLKQITATFFNIRTWWLGLQWSGRVYHWLDGTPYNVQLVPGGSDLPSRPPTPCVAIRDQTVMVADCNNWFNLMCKRPKSTPLTCDVDNQWQYINGSCYKTYLDKRTWDDAKSLCELKDAQLASVTTFLEHSVLWDTVRDISQPTALWTGLRVVRQSGQLQMTWLDGTILNSSETFWKSNSAQNTLRLGTSMAIDGRVPRRLKSWYLANQTEHYAYACQRPEGVCAAGWLTHQTNCFKLIDMNVGWEHASFVCRGTGGQLVSLATLSNQLFIQSYLPVFRAEGHNSVWIGISDGGDDQSPFTWPDGTAIGNASHWAQQSPPNNTLGSRDCGYINTDDVDGRWQMTSDCTQPRSFVCSIPVNTAVHAIPTSPTPTGLLCEAGWLTSNGKCYYFADQNKNWQDANQACVSLGGQLVMILSDTEQAFINSQMSRANYWIGLSDLSTEGSWVWVNNSAMSGYLNWARGEPNSYGGVEEDCGALWGTKGESMLGQWNDAPCDRAQQYICQKAPSIKPVPSSSTPTTTRRGLYSAKCGAGWEERPHSDYCYQFHDEAKTQPGAVQACQTLGATLVSITDLAEQSYLAGRASSMQMAAVWIGATDSNIEGGWAWMDGSPFAYVNWNAGEPNNAANGQDCAAMITKTSRWNDFTCHFTLGYICKKLASSHSTTPQPTTTPLPAGKYWSCPTGYIGFQSNCYMTHTTLKTWDQALRACRSEGGDLASLATTQENDFLFSMLPADTTNLTGSWLGLSEQARVKGSFTWSDGSRVSFTNWHTGMPMPFPARTCVLMKKGEGNGWMNAPCGGMAKYVCKKPMTAVSATPLSPFRVGCPVRALGYESYCYNVVTTPMSWTQADQFCRRSHGYLATVNSIAVQSFVTSQLKQSAGHHYWIGLSDTAQPGTLTWSSKSPVLFTAWNSNHTGNERSTCIGMQTSHPVGLWQTLHCSANKPFVCQYPRSGYTTPSIPTTSTATVTTTPTPCPSGWSGFEQFCYKATTETGSLKSWSGARDVCRSYGGDLASVHNNSVNNFFHDTLLRNVRVTNGNLWIGLTDADNEATYVWSDGSPMQFAKWNTGEPNNAGGNEDCAEYNVYGNAWNDNSCYIVNAFICSLPRGQPLITTLHPPTTTPTPTCDGTEWLSKDGFCYYVSPLFGENSRKTWFQARRFCQSNGADLASIESEAVNSFLTQYVTNQQASQREYWIGFNKLGRDSYIWSDSSPVVYTSWSATEPNNGYGGQSCANVYSLSGKWNDDNCNDEFHYICKRSNSSSAAMPPVPTPLIRGGCPTGFSGVGNKCYIVGGLTASTALNYEAARSACRSMTSRHPVDIASITNHQQQAFVMSLLEGSVSPAFIGLNDMHTTGKFVWQNNEEVTVTYWAPNEPSETGSRLHFGVPKAPCVVMRVEEKTFGLWDDTMCETPHAYVCETMKDVSYPIVQPDRGSCRYGYYHYRDSCYGVYKTPQSWDAAEQTCIMDSGHLVSIRDIHELAKVALFIYHDVVIQPVWIGLSVDQDGSEYGWKDGWPVQMVSWGEGEPDRSSNRSCVTMVNGVWNDTDCQETNPYVCKISSATPPPTTPPPPGHCANTTWAPYNDYCYYAQPYNKRSWPEANYLCRQLGMDLLSLHNTDELSFIQSLINLAVTTPRYSYQALEKRLWLGLQRNMDGGFRWSDDSPFDYFDWNDGEPNNANNEEQCAELLVDSGKWNDIACISSSSVGERGFVCKTSKIFPTTTTTTTTTSTTTTTTTTTTTSTNRHTSRTPSASSTDPGRTGKSIRAKDSPTLSGGKIAGIVIGLIALILIIGAVVFIVRRRHVHQLDSNSMVEHAAGFENALYTKSETKEGVALESNGNTSSHVANGSNGVSLSFNHADDEDC